MRASSRAAPTNVAAGPACLGRQARALSDEGQCAPRSVLKNGPNLLRGGSGKPFDELRHLRVILEILKLGRHKHAGAAEYPGAVRAFRVT